MSPSRRRSGASIIPITGVLGFLLIAALVSDSIVAFYAVLFVALIYVAISLMMRPRADG